MLLSDIVDPGAIDTSLPGESREEAIRHLAGLLAGRAGLPLEDELVRGWARRDARGWSRLVGEVFLYQWRAVRAGEPRLAAGRRGAREFLFILLAPVAAGRTAFQVITALTCLARRQEALAALQAAEGSAAFHRALAATGIALPPTLLVRDIMTRAVHAVPVMATLREVADLMIFEGISGLPVINEKEEVLGVITEKELIKVFLPEYRDVIGEAGPGRPPKKASAAVDLGEKFLVKDFMSRSILCISEDATISEAATLMVNKNVRRLPVVAEGKLVGIVTRRDIVEGVMRGWFL